MAPAATAAGRAVKTRKTAEKTAPKRDEIRVTDARGATKPRATTAQRSARNAAPTTRRTASSAGTQAASYAPSRKVQRPVAPRRPRRQEPAKQSRRRSGSGPARPLLVSSRVHMPAFAVAVPHPHLRLRVLRLDRIVRGRAWIPVLGVLLVAVVGMRVEVLKMGTRTGVNVEQATELGAQNQALRGKVARLSAAERIMEEAEQQGMIPPQPTALKFIHAAGVGNVKKAIDGITKPNAAEFEAGGAGTASSTDPATDETEDSTGVTDSLDTVTATAATDQVAPAAG